MLLICEVCHRHWHLRSTAQRRATCPRCHRLRVELGQKRRLTAYRLQRMIQERVRALGGADVPLDLEKLMGEVEAASARALQAAREVVSKKF